MRLINVDTRELHWHNDDALPRYAIFSHTWAEDEVTFRDMQHASQRQPQDRLGYRKVDFACQRAKADGLYWVWVDTCCIDKSSSAELSEAINSMFSWYNRARVCYAHLADYHHDPEHTWRAYTTEDGFTTSKWFSRGWTLQELIAPGFLKFYDQDFRFLWSRTQVVQQLVAATGVPAALLERDNAEPSEIRETLDTYSVAQRMSWASNRRTTRVEDEAYSLFGIFDVNLPMLYGEGRKAFLRLQEEIIRTSTDLSILVHDDRDLLALSPKAFALYGNVTTEPHLTFASQPFETTNRGLRMTLPVSRTPINTAHKLAPGVLSMALDCVERSRETNKPALHYYLTLFPVSATTHVYHLHRLYAPVETALKNRADSVVKTVFLLRRYSGSALYFDGFEFEEAVKR